MTNKTNAQTQADYRERRAFYGDERINTLVSEDAKECLRFLAKTFGKSQRHIIEYLLINEYNITVEYLRKGAPASGE